MSFEIPQSLTDLQDKLFEALAEFDRLCAESGCNYSLICGTLLGAVRHKGFIPWDDDIDVVMFRADFERFRIYCMTTNTMGNTYLDEKDTWVPRIRIDERKDVFVDIFILDKAAPDEKQQKRTLFKLKLLQGMMKKEIIYSRYSVPNKVLVFGTHLLGIPFSFDWKYKRYHELAQKYNNTKTEKYYIADGAFSVISIIWEKDEFNTFIRSQFRNKEFLITAQYESVLTKLFGSTYMQLPPEKERIPKHSG